MQDAKQQALYLLPLGYICILHFALHRSGTVLVKGSGQHRCD
jgi:hypothetical protein